MQNIFDTLIISIIFLIIILIITLINQKYKNNLKYILNNIIKVYKNFAHWSMSKVIFLIYATFCSLILSLPFLGILVFLFYKVAYTLKPDRISSYLLSNTIDDSLKNAVWENITTFGIIIIMLLIIFVIITSIFMYAYFLQQRILKEYLVWNKIKFSENKFFDFRWFLKYFLLIGCVAIRLLIPILIGLWYMIIVAFLSMNFESMNSLFTKESLGMWIFQLIILISLLIWFITLAIRLSFAYMIFLYDEKMIQSPFFYVKKSLEITKWKVFKIISLGLPFFFIAIIIEAITKGFRQSYPWIFTYFTLETITFLGISWINFMIFISIFHIITDNKYFLSESKKSSENISSEDLNNESSQIL